MKDMSKMFKDMKIPKHKEEHTAIESPSMPMYRTMRFNAKELPDIKNWKVGEMYYVGLKLKQVGKEEMTSMKKDMDKISAEFEIHGVMPDMMGLFEKKNSKHDTVVKALKEYKK